MVWSGRGRSVVVAVLAGAVVLELAACGGGGSDMPGLTASPSVTASATPSPTPSAEPTELPEELGVVFDLSDPELGIVFEDTPTELTGDAADVHNAIALFTREVWRSVVTHVVSPVIREMASAEVIEALEADAETNEATGSIFGGVHRATITDIRVDGDTATGSVCRDYQDGTFANAEAEYTPDEAGFGEPRLYTHTLANLGGGVWRVQSTERAGTC